MYTVQDRDIANYVKPIKYNNLLTI
jgi:hypothetical protein